MAVNPNLVPGSPSVPNINSPGPSSLPIFTRRDFIRNAVLLTAFGIISGKRQFDDARKSAYLEKGVTPPDKKSPPNKERIKTRDKWAAPNAENWATGELTYNKMETFMTGFAHLDRQHIILMDQNGQIVGGEMIEIPVEVQYRAEAETADQFKARFNKWLHGVREDIKKTYPTVFVRHDYKREEPTLVSVRLSVSEEKDKLGIRMFDQIWTRANEPVSKKNQEARFRYAKRKIAESGVPEDLQKLMIGVCATESGFGSMPENKEKCAGPWQISREEATQHGLMRNETTYTWENVKVPIESKKSKIKSKKKEKKGLIGKFRRAVNAAAEKLKKPKFRIVRKKVPKIIPVDDRDDFEASTKVAVILLKQRYTRWSKEGKDNFIRAVQNLYEVSDQDFLYPAVVNTYHSGPKRINDMMKWFLDNYKPEDVSRILGPGPYGRDLYTLITSIYPHSETREDPLFGQKSRDYTIKASAMAELLSLREQGASTQIPVGYTPPAGDEEPEEEISGKYGYAVHEVLETGHPQTVGVGLIAGTVAMLVQRVLKGGNSRRDFIKFMAAGGTVAYLGKYLGAEAEAATRSYIPEGVKTEEPKDINPNRFAPFKLEQREISQLILEHVPASVMKKIPPRTIDEIRRSKDDISRALEHARKNKLPLFDSVESIASAPGIKQWDQFGTRFYRLRGVGFAENGVVRNDPKYCYGYPEIQQLVQEIDEELNAELQKIGFPNNLWVRLVLQSASRDADLQKRIKEGDPSSGLKGNEHAARKISPHQFGNTVDIHRYNYDIIEIGKEHEIFGMITLEDQASKKLGMSMKINAVLGRILLKKKQQGKLTVLDEGANHVYHISAV